MNYVITKTFHGQQIEYYEDEKLVRTYIKEPFWTASKKLGWDIKSPGLGLNTDIMVFILDNECDLKIKVESVGKEYIIPLEILKDFIDNNNSYYHKTGVDLEIIPWKLFTDISLSEKDSKSKKLTDYC